MNNYRPMRSLTQQSNEKRKVVYIMPPLDPATNFIWINNKLSGPDKFSSLRFLPSFDENGNELEFIVPGADPANMISCLSNAFYQVEMTSLYRNGEVRYLVTTLAPTDRRGNEIPRFYKSVAGMIISRFNYNVLVAKQMIAKGYKSCIPSSWIEKYDRKLTNEQKPYVATMVQAMASTIDGISMRNAAGEATFVPGVFILQKTALDSLLGMFKSLKDMSKPISQSNLNPNSDLFSCASGQLVQYSMQLKKGMGERERPVYSLVSTGPSPIPVDVARNVVKPWNQLIQEPFIDDQISMFIDWLGADVVDFGLTNSPYEDYIPATARGKGSHVECTTLKWDEVKAMPLNPNREVVNKQETMPATVMMPVQQPQQQVQPVAMPAMPQTTPAPARPARVLNMAAMDGVEDLGGSSNQTPPPPPPMPIMGQQAKPAPVAVPPGAADYANNLLKSMAALGKK